MINQPYLNASQFILYADDNYHSHVVRLLLEEKQLDYQHIFIEEDRPEELTELNPYHTLPVLVNRDLALYEMNVIFEYLEERHQIPKLLPSTPKLKAQTRLLAWRIQKDWLSCAINLLMHPHSFDKPLADKARKELSDSLVTLSPLFSRQEYFLSDTFGWCDILILPMLWRLPDMEIVLPPHLCRPLIEYQQRLFDRPSFQASIKFKESL